MSKYNLHCESCGGDYTAIVTSLISWQGEFHEREGEVCRMCGKKAHVIGYPANLSLLSKEMDMNLGDRQKYAKDIVQAFRQGEFSNEYKQAYPEKAKEMVKDGVITKKQHDTAKDVWKGDVPGL